MSKLETKKRRIYLKHPVGTKNPKIGALVTFIDRLGLIFGLEAQTVVVASPPL